LAGMAVSDVAYRRGYRLAEQGEVLRSYQAFQLAELFSPGIDIIYVTHADLIRHLLGSLPAADRNQRRNFFDEADELLDHAQTLNPYQPLTLLVRGRLYQ